MPVTNKTPQPAQPPKFARKLRFHIFQMIGIPLLFLMPVLALAGVFGKSSDVVSASSTALELQVSYPTRFRYKVTGSVNVMVRNLTDTRLPTVVVSFEEAYVSKFSDVSFIPVVNKVTARFYRVALFDLQPEETQLVRLELQAEDYGIHHGVIQASLQDASAEPTDSVQVSIRTLVFP